jgi:Mrp family chromosome partitioning ATPase
VLSIIIALIGGLVLGLGAVFALQLLDPKLRREDQLSERFSLPILAAIPKERRPRNGPPLRRSQLSAGGQEGYNTLRAALTVSRRIQTPGGRTVMITGPSRGDGKTTSALNLAAALANGRQDVILVDADWRRPAVGRALDLNSGLDVHADMQRELSLEQALVTIGEAGAALRVLPTMPGSVAAEVALSSPDAESLLLRATAISDWVVVDSPPLNHVPDLLALARQVDDVVLVVHLGRTDLRELAQLSEMLMQQDITPTGFVVIGASRGYY